ncbi:MAG: acyl--CoA ligase [Bacilli bacterium]|nr:acyl--CoA ligase [Bacilli bacterium]
MLVNENHFVSYTVKEEFERIKCFDSLSELWENSVKEFKKDVALSDISRSWTYEQLDLEVAHFRAILKEKGINKGDFVGVFAPNSLEWVKAYLAIETLGGVAVLLPPFLPTEALFGCSIKFKMKALVYYPSLKEKVDGLVNFPHRMTLIDATSTSEKVEPSVSVNPKDPASIIFTGGTTGKSKGALLNNKALCRGACNGCFGIKHVFKQKYLLVLPLTHVFGLVRNLLTSLQTGSALFITQNNKDMFRDIAVFRPTVMVMVPALAEMCLNLSKQFNKNMLGDSLSYIIAGASTVAPFLVKEYKKYNITLLPGYGLTESANLVSGNPRSEYKPASVGFPYPHQELKVVDGELWIKGDNVMDCYYGEEEENKNAFSEDGFFKTGDLVRFDEEGFLYIVGRIKEIIVLPTGEKISPFDLENKFDELDIIQDTMVYLEENTNRLVLSVYPRMGEMMKLDVNDKEEFLKEQIKKINNLLPSFSRISKIVIRKEDFKRTPAMKIIRGKVNIDD